MPCYHPRTVSQTVDLTTGEVISRYLGSEYYKVLKTGNGFYDRSHDFSDRGDRLIAVPCGKCIGCRLDYSRQWADRMMLELDHSPRALFVTLTYDDLHLMLSPVSSTPTLFKKHPQDFLKRLRYYFPDREIRYYLCGEYGDRTHRPHYHAILYGIDLNDFSDAYLVGYNSFDQPLYASPFFMSIWSHGLCSLADVSWRTCAYVSRYVTKKVYKEDPSLVLDVQKEYSVMSRRPGIAGYYFQDHIEEIEHSRFAYVKNLNDLKYDCGSKKVVIPKYVLNGLEETNPVLFQEIKDARQKFSDDKLFLELTKTNLDDIMYLNSKETDTRHRVVSLKERGDL